LDGRPTMLVWGGLHQRGPTAELELLDIPSRVWRKGFHSPGWFDLLLLTPVSPCQFVHRRSRRAGAVAALRPQLRIRALCTLAWRNRRHFGGPPDIYRWQRRERPGAQRQGAAGGTLCAGQPLRPSYVTSLTFTSVYLCTDPRAAHRAGQRCEQKRCVFFSPAGITCVLTDPLCMFYVLSEQTCWSGRL
jgi:hypothetical protein